MENENRGMVKFNFSLDSFSALLTIAFIILKLCHVIEWAWVWVLAPLWMSLAFSLVLVIVVLVVAAIIHACRKF